MFAMARANYRTFANPLYAIAKLKEIKMSKTEKKLLDIINTMISLCEPVKYKDFNCIIKAKDVSLLRKAEEKNTEIGLANFDKENEGISTLSLIATITDVLIKKRLAFNIDDEGMITGVTFYEE